MLEGDFRYQWGELVNTVTIARSKSRLPIKIIISLEFYVAACRYFQIPIPQCKEDTLRITGHECVIDPQANFFWNIRQ